MPKYYCDYCDTYLTHDSPSVRKTHCQGRKHKDNVRFYYQKWMEEQAQQLIDATTAMYKAGKISGHNPYVSKGGVAIPPPGSMPMMPPGMIPPMPPGPMPNGFPMPPPGMMFPPMGGPPMGMPPPMMMPRPPMMRPPLLATPQVPITQQS